MTDVEATARRLSERGILLERHEGLPEDELGIWSTPDESRVAWSKDSDGDTLSIAQRGEARCPQSA